jgi:hypothetical protein
MPDALRNERTDYTAESALMSAINGKLFAAVANLRSETDVRDHVTGVGNSPSVLEAWPDCVICSRLSRKRSVRETCLSRKALWNFQTRANHLWPPGDAHSRVVYSLSDFTRLARDQSIKDLA